MTSSFPDRLRGQTVGVTSWTPRKPGSQAARRAEQFDAALADLGATEEFHAYPGLHLMAALRDCAASDDARATVALVRRISTALITRSFRRNSGDWNLHDDGEAAIPDMLPSTFGHTDTQKPYFETLIVTGVPADRWSGLCAEWRRLRRPLDAFVYEPVLVGSVEDAFCAIMLNADLASVVINEGFVFRSRHDVPVLRTVSEAMEQKFKTELSALQLAELVKRVRPELDIFIVSNRRVEELAGNPKANVARRIFYSVEELLELHLAVLEGVQDRYDTPFFDNLKKYAQRPIGTFHALPIARGKSVFKSDWIRDMGEFYGINLFLAESSATTGGLDSLLEPTGNIKKAQDMAARAFGADHVFFVTNGTSTSNKMAVQALVGPGDIEHRRSELPQVAPLRNGAGGRAAALRRSLPDDRILDVWRGAAARRSSRPCSILRPRAGSTGPRWST